MLSCLICDKNDQQIFLRNYLLEIKKDHNFLKTQKFLDEVEV